MSRLSRTPNRVSQEVLSVHTGNVGTTVMFTKDRAHAYQAATACTHASLRPRVPLPFAVWASPPHSLPALCTNTLKVCEGGSREKESSGQFTGEKPALTLMVNLGPLPPISSLPFCLVHSLCESFSFSRDIGLNTPDHGPGYKYEIKQVRVVFSRS